MRALTGEPPRELDAEFDLKFHHDCISITVHSRGGSASHGNQRNPEYELLVQSLLERLKDANADLREVLLASRTVAKLSRSERRIEVDGFDFPIEMVTVPDVTELRLAIRRAVVHSHSTSTNALHGNATKKIELVASCPVSPLDMVAVLTNGIPGTDENEAETDSDAYIEGRRVLQTHLRRERNQSLVRGAKSQFKARNGRLFCEVCEFDFSQIYGQLGEGFIEAHHEEPLSDREEESETRIVDLRMVCANCHRMLHRTGVNHRLVTIDELKRIVDGFQR